MDFTDNGMNSFGKDEIGSSTYYNYDPMDLFITSSMVDASVKFPVPGHNYQVPAMENKFMVPQTLQQPVKSNFEQYPPYSQTMTEPNLNYKKLHYNLQNPTMIRPSMNESFYGGSIGMGEGFISDCIIPNINESTLLIMLLVILVIICSMTYMTINNTNTEMLRLLNEIVLQSRGLPSSTTAIS
jgi:hypothetical protein